MLSENTHRLLSHTLTGFLGGEVEWGRDLAVQKVDSQFCFYGFLLNIVEHLYISLSKTKI
jgi:hypothetical protein